MSTIDRAKDDWLESLSSGYRVNARATFKDFLEFLESVDKSLDSGDSIIKRHEENRKSEDKKVKFQFDDLMPVFAKWLEGKGLKHNTSVGKTYSLVGFFKFHRQGLELQKGSLEFEETEKNFHTFKYPELVAMANVGGLEVKAILQTEIQLGLRIGDFCELTRAKIERASKDIDESGILEFTQQTEKESIVAICHLTKDTYDLLKLYWESVAESELAFNLSTDAINDKIKQSWERAYPDRKDERVRFHELRAYTITTFQDCLIPDNALKAMVGKKVDSAMKTYLLGQNLREPFSKCIPKLVLSGSLTNGNNHKIENLEETIRRQQSQIVDLETRLGALENMRFVDITKTVTDKAKTLVEIIKEQSQSQ